MRKRWSSWSEMEDQYRQGAAELKKVRENLAADRAAEREIIGSAVGSMQETARILQKKVLYEFGSFSEDELALLTDRQRQIAELRQRYSYTEIAKMTGLRPDEVFHIFRQAITKIKKTKRQKKEKIPVGLSPQQERIYVLFQQGLKPKEIALRLGISGNVVYVQLGRIKNILNKVIQK